LRQHDTLIQRGTMHAWQNRSDQPALLLFVLLDAEALQELPPDLSSLPPDLNRPGRPS